MNLEVSDVFYLAVKAAHQRKKIIESAKLMNRKTGAGFTLTQSVEQVAELEKKEK